MQKNVESPRFKFYQLYALMPKLFGGRKQWKNKRMKWKLQEIWI
jgi:hypothetical protein